MKQFTRCIGMWLAGTALVFTGGGAGAQETTLRAAVFVPITSAYGEVFGRFIEKINKEGKGLVQIRLVGGPEAVPSFEQGNAVRGGVLDMASIPPSFYASIAPEADAAILSNQSVPLQRKSGAWDELNRIHNQKMGSWLLATYGQGVAFHLYTNKPVAAIGDVKSLKLRTVPNYTPFFTTLGATLATLPPGEVQAALERGVVDGYGWPLLGIFDLGWGQYTKYRVEPGFYDVVVNILVNLNKWKSLREDQRAFLLRMGQWMDEDNMAWVKEKSAIEMKRQRDAGINAVNLGPAYRSQAYNAYWAELTKRAPDAIKTLRPLLEK
ncbi:MAG: ABC transporter substrate-binding protein [Betaproteobacteria bacterium]|nr:ABC transporter substrate-binding protein [Betaproteobacteria bacterium]